MDWDWKTAGTFTTSTDPAKLPEWATKPLTFDDLVSFSEAVEKLRTPPPDKSKCKNCGEPMENDGHPIYSGTMMFGTPACYVCGRCFYLLRGPKRDGSASPLTAKPGTNPR